MRLPTALALGLVAIVGVLAWHAELYSVQKPGAHPVALALDPAPRRAPIAFDVVLPVVPIGLTRVRSGDGPLLVHYWAPWERHSRAQAHDLDSLAKSAASNGVRVVVVCFDPFPSVARYVARQRLQVPVLLDGQHHLAATLPCPSLPFTYLVDPGGRIAAAIPGEIDWWAPATLATLRALASEPDSAPPATPAPI
jgi:peroxiredoxin